MHAQFATRHAAFCAKALGRIGKGCAEKQTYIAYLLKLAGLVSEGSSVPENVEFRSQVISRSPQIDSGVLRNAESDLLNPNECVVLPNFYRLAGQSMIRSERRISCAGREKIRDNCGKV